MKSWKIGAIAGLIAGIIAGLVAVFITTPLVFKLGLPYLWKPLPPETSFTKIAMVLRQQLQEVGIKIRAVLFDDEAELENKEFLAQYKPQARIKLFLGAYVDAAVGDWGSKGSKRVQRLWAYSNEEVDKLIELGEKTQDEAKRKKIYQKMHRIIYADQPACFLYFPYLFHAVAGKFENMDDFFSLHMPIYTIKDCYLKTVDGQR